MTRKDYIKLAAAFAVEKPTTGVNPYDAESKLDQWRRDVHAVADVLAWDNGRFDRQRFLEAATVAVR